MTLCRGKGWIVAYDVRLAHYERIAMDATSNYRLWRPTMGASMQTQQLKNAMARAANLGQILLQPDDKAYLMKSLETYAPDEQGSAQFYRCECQPSSPYLMPSMPAGLEEGCCSRGLRLHDVSFTTTLWRVYLSH